MGSLAAGDRLGTYEIAAIVGAGGMGEVYRAIDLHLQREVAIKALRDESRDHATTRGGLEDEALALSGLNHPNICTVHDVIERDGRRFLVMEYLHGETIAQRLLRGPLPIDQVFRVAAELADALQHAHARGVVHCDVKPSNIMLTASGAKLLDFGVASARSARPAAPDDTTLQHGAPGPTGTLRYMAPEQVEGGRIDGRTDIFALGAVIVEMVTGHPAFPGESAARTMAAILTATPPALAGRDPTLADLDRIVSKCLARERERRWQSAGDLADELRWAAERRVMGLPRASRAWRIGVPAAVLAAALAIAGTLAVGSRSAERLPPVQFGIDLERGTRLSLLADPLSLSPDGRHLAFVAATPGGPTLLWVRPLDSLRARPLPHTEGAQGPFWAPDSSHIAFFAEGVLKTTTLDGESMRVVCRTSPGFSGSWSEDGVILFSTATRQPIVRVPADGGTPTPVTAVDERDVGHFWPQFLPGSRKFIYLVRSPDAERAGVYLGALDDPRSARLFHSDSQAVFAPPGYLLSMRDGQLAARPFDQAADRLGSEVMPLGISVAQNRFNHFFGRSAFTVARDVLVYRVAERRELIWFDRTGQQQGRIGGPGAFTNVELSRDRRRIAVGQFSPQGAEDVSIIDVAGGATHDVTSAVSPGLRPVWAPDSTRLMFVSHRANRFRLYEKEDPGSGERLRLDLPMTTALGPTDWATPSLILFERMDAATRKDVWGLHVGSKQEPFLIVQTKADDLGARLSPEGHWIAYTSNTSGSYEVYVQPFPSGGSPIRVSTEGGIEPRWTRGGRELLYIEPGGALMSVDMTVLRLGNPPRPRRLFASPLNGLLEFASGDNQYDVTADGNRLLLSVPVESPGRLYGMLHWRSAISPTADVPVASTVSALRRASLR